MVVVDGVMVAEKRTSNKMLWDLDAMRKEEAKGVDSASFKHWTKGGLSVNNSCCGTCLVGTMISLECVLVTNPRAKCETLKDETNHHDVSFPGVDARKATMEEGAKRQSKIRCHHARSHSP